MTLCIPRASEFSMPTVTGFDGLHVWPVWTRKIVHEMICPGAVTKARPCACIDSSCATRLIWMVRILASLYGRPSQTARVDVDTGTSITQPRTRAFHSALQEWERIRTPRIPESFAGMLDTVLVHTAPR